MKSNPIEIHAEAAILTAGMSSVGDALSRTKGRTVQQWKWEAMHSKRSRNQ